MAPAGVYVVTSCAGSEQWVAGEASAKVGRV